MSLSIPSLWTENVERADLGRLGALDERLLEDARAQRCCNLSRVAIDVHKCDALRRVELRAGLPRQGALHERRPDRERRLRATEPDRLIVVEPDPHDGEE